jgi:hypothetical protein
MVTKRRRRDYEIVPVTQEERTQILSKGPLDFTVLRKGLYLPVDLIEEITTTHRKDPQFWAKLLDLCKAIKDSTPFCTTTVKRGILVLNDENALHYEQKFSWNRVRGIFRNASNVYNKVDAEQLSLESQVRLERFKNRTDRFLFALESARTGLRIGKIRRALGQ